MPDLLPILRDYFKQNTSLSKEEFKKKINDTYKADETNNAQKKVLTAVSKNLDRFDANTDGKITLDEIDYFAKNSGNKDGQITLEDFPQIAPPPRANDGNIPTRLSQYAKEGATGDQFGITKPIDLGAIELNSQTGLMAQMFFRTDADERNRLHILIYSGKDFSNDENKVQEYIIDLGDPESPANGTLRSFAQNEKNIQFKLTKNEFLTNIRRPPGSRLIDSSQTDELRNTIASLLFKKDETSGIWDLNQDALDYFKSNTKIKCRQARGISNLFTGSFEYVPDISATPAAISLPGSLSSSRTTLDNYLKDIDSQTGSSGDVNEGKITGLDSEWHAIKDFDKDAIGKFYRVDLPDGTHEYRLLIASYDKDAQEDSKYKTAEFYISEDALKKIAQTDGANINFNDTKSVRNWFFTHFKFENNSLEAIKEKQEGSALFGEIMNEQTTSLMWREGKGATLEEAVKELNESSIVEDPATKAKSRRTSWYYSKNINSPQGPFGFVNATISGPETVQNDPIDTKLKNTGDSKNPFVKPSLRGLPVFKFTQAGSNVTWYTKIVLQDEYITIYYRNDSGECIEHVIHTDAILRYLKQKSGMDFSDILPSKFDSNSTEHRDKLKKFYTTLSGLIANSPNGDTREMGEYLERSLSSVDKLFTSVTRKENDNHSVTQGFTHSRTKESGFSVNR